MRSRRCGHWPRVTLAGVHTRLPRKSEWRHFDCRICSVAHEVEEGVKSVDDRCDPRKEHGSTASVSYSIIAVSGVRLAVIVKVVASFRRIVCGCDTDSTSDEEAHSDESVSTDPKEGPRKLTYIFMKIEQSDAQHCAAKNEATNRNEYAESDTAVGCVIRAADTDDDDDAQDKFDNCKQGADRSKIAEVQSLHRNDWTSGRRVRLLVTRHHNRMLLHIAHSRSDAKR